MGQIRSNPHPDTHHFHFSPTILQPPTHTRTISSNSSTLECTLFDVSIITRSFSVIFHIWLWSAKEKILKLVSNQLSKEQIEQSIIYLNYEPFTAGETIKAGRRSIEVKKNSYMAFIDLQPRLNWGHSCIYILIDSATFETEIIDAQFPPYHGDYPESYRVLLRYGASPPHDRYFNVFD